MIHFCWISVYFDDLPSGELSHSNGKIHYAINGKIHYLMAIFHGYLYVHQRVLILSIAFSANVLAKKQFHGLIFPSFPTCSTIFSHIFPYVPRRSFQAQGAPSVHVVQRSFCPLQYTSCHCQRLSTMSSVKHGWKIPKDGGFLLGKS